MTSSKQVNIRKSLRQSITNIPCDDSGQTTNLGVFSAYLYTHESCDGLQRHDHVMLPRGALMTIETPMCLNGFRSIFRMGHSMSDQRVFCNDLLRFALNLACLLTFNILTKVQMLCYVSRALFEI